MKKWIGFLLCFFTSAVHAQLSLTGAGFGSAILPPFTVQPLFAWPGPAASAPSAVQNTFNYAAFVGANAGSTFYGASFAARGSTWSVAGTIANLSVSIPNANITQGSYTFCIVAVSGTCSAVTCAIGASQTSCTDISHSVATVAGNTYAIATDPTGATNTSLVGQGPIEVSATWTSTVGNESALLCSPNAAASWSTTAINYIACGSQDGTNATEYVVSGLVSAAGVIDELYVSESALAGTGSEYTYAVFHNGVVTALACTPGSTPLVCNTASGVNAITVAVGDTISIGICPSAASPLAVWCNSDTTVPALITGSAALRFVPTSRGLSMVIGLAGTLAPISPASYNTLAGVGNNSSTDNIFNIAPYVGNLPAGVSLQLKNLVASVCPGPGTGVTRTFATYVGGSLANPEVIVPSGSTACGTQTVSPQDTTDSITLANNATYSMSSQLNTTTGASTALAVKWAMTAQAVP